MSNTQIVSTKLELSILSKFNLENRNLVQNKFETKKWCLYQEQEKKELLKLYNSKVYSKDDNKTTKIINDSQVKQLQELLGLRQKN